MINRISRGARWLADGVGIVWGSIDAVAEYLEDVSPVEDVSPLPLAEPDPRGDMPDPADAHRVMNRFFDRLEIAEDRPGLVALSQATTAVIMGLVADKDIEWVREVFQVQSDQLDGVESIAVACAVAACVLAECVEMPTEDKRCLLCAIGAGLLDEEPLCKPEGSGANLN